MYTQRVILGIHEYTEYKSNRKPDRKWRKNADGQFVGWRMENHELSLGAGEYDHGTEKYAAGGDGMG